ncbi:MAG TPA: ABC transporter permease [Planctomycetota bacterium]|nr:ABC transporter permease [Planctomycetota bacterium]
MTERLSAEVTRRDGRTEVRALSGLENADVRDAERFARRLPRPLGDRVTVSLAPERLGARGAAVLDRFCAALEREGATAAVVPADAEQRGVLEDFEAAPPGTRRAPPPPRAPAFDPSVRALNLTRKMLQFGLGGVLAPRRFRWDAFVGAILDVGMSAVPLTVIISVLIGAVLALQAGPLFEQYGQETLVAQLVAMAQLKEIGPLLTAILVAGRTASSLAAEIGAMKSAEELDALEVMGTSPIRALVVPRWWALVLALPVLTLIADVAGVLGGMTVGIAALDLSAGAWLDQTLRAAKLKDVVGGLCKAAAFATALIAVAAHQGFSADGGAAGVGRRTTRAVVFGILAVIIVDALFTLVIYGMDSR